MSFQAEFTEQFWEDYEAALTYLADDLENPGAAYALDRELDRVVRLLMRYPHVSAPYPFLEETGAPYYHYPVRRFFAFYVIRGETVQLRRFLHAAADLPARLEE